MNESKEAILGSHLFIKISWKNQKYISKLSSKILHLSSVRQRWLHTPATKINTRLLRLNKPLSGAVLSFKRPYVRVNPRQSREFARATGRLAKTDKVDAKVLAQMGAALRLAPTPHPDKTRAELADMMPPTESVKAGSSILNSGSQ